MAYTRIRRPLKERLMARVRVAESGCWEWTGWRNNMGYGMLLGVGKSLVLAHRASYEIHVGAIPDGRQVLHSCDNPACVNPEHLSLGTVLENMADMVRKGRSTRGERHGQSRLSDDDIRAIRSDRSSTQKAIARRFGICRSAVSMIRAGKRWGHVQ